MVFPIFLVASTLTGQAGTGPIPGDFDAHGDVDLVDFAEFQTCALGSTIAQTSSECIDAHLDADDDVDLDDFEVFERCFSGAESPADPNCACASGETICDDTCTSTSSDEANCGACGHACTTGLACQNGACTLVVCAPGLADCDQNGSCETSTSWDFYNCGGCNTQCSISHPSQTCALGTCVDVEPCMDCGF
jgi:hypothetical protein